MTPQPPPSGWRHPGGTPHRQDSGEYRRHLKVWRRGGTHRQPDGGTLAAPEQLALDLEPGLDWIDWFLSLPITPGSPTTVAETLTATTDARAHARPGARIRPTCAHTASCAREATP